MTWAGLSANEWVSFTAAQTSGLTPLLTLPTSDQWMSKSVAATYLTINTSWASYAAKTSSQWVAKQDLVAPYQNSGTLNYVNFDVGHNGSYGGWSSAALACALGGALTVTVYWNGTLGNGTILYYANGIAVAAANTTDFFYMGGNSFTSSVNGAFGGGPFTVATYATCTPVMNFGVHNNSATKSTFTATVNGVNVTGMVAISLTGTATTTGTTVSEIIGANTVILTGGASTKTIAASGAIIDAVTTSAVTYSITSGNGTTNLILSVTLTSGNETNGILITIS